MVKWFRTAHLEDVDLDTLWGAIQSDPKYKDPQSVVDLANDILGNFDSYFDRLRSARRPELGSVLTVSPEKLRWLWGNMRRRIVDLGGDPGSFPDLEPRLRQ